MKKLFIGIAAPIFAMALCIMLWHFQPRKKYSVVGIYLYIPRDSTSKPSFRHRIEIKANGKYTSSCGNGVSSFGKWSLKTGKDIADLELTNHIDCDGKKWQEHSYDYDLRNKFIIANDDDNYILYHQ